MSTDDTAASDAPFPAFVEPPRDGDFERFYDDTDQLRIEGSYADGLKTGLWTEYYPDGQKKSQFQYVDGVKHGPAKAWFANGQLEHNGEWERGKKTGNWTEWYESGAYKQTYRYEDGKEHGPYEWDTEEGEKRARGEFKHGVRHGQWTWWNGDTYQRTVRGYSNGFQHGEEAAWYENGQLAYRRHWSDGKRHGDEVEFHPDGSPKTEATWKHDYPNGEKRSWDEDGNETVEEFVDGLPIELAEDDELLEQTADRIQSADDQFAQTDILRNAVDFNYRTPFLLHLVRSGHLDMTEVDGLWSEFVGAHPFLSAEEALDFLADAEVPDHHTASPFGGWPKDFDRLAMTLYRRDPEPFEDSFDDLPRNVRRGVALVMARFGKEDAFDGVDDFTGEFAETFLDNYITDYLLWPDEDGELQQLDICELSVPTDYFDRMLEFFTTADTFGEAMLEIAFDETEHGVSHIDFSKMKHAIERATLEQFAALLEGIALNSKTESAVERAIFEWRDDDATALAEIAIGLEESGLRKWPPVCCAILKLDEQNAPIPDELVDALELGNANASVSWIDQKLRRLPSEDHQFDVAHFDHLVDFSDPTAAFPRMKLLFRAMNALSEDQRRSVIERTMDKDYGASAALPWLHTVDDEALWKRGIELCHREDHLGDAAYYGLGLLPLDALPLLAAAHDEADGHNRCKFFKRALIAQMARLADDDVLWDEKWDDYLSFNVVEQSYQYRQIRPMLRKVIHRLPRQRAVPVIEGGLQMASTFARAFRCVPSHPEPELVELAFRRLLERESKLNNDDEREVGNALRGFSEIRPLVKWFMQIGGGSHIDSQLATAVGGRDELEAIRTELADEGVEPPEELDRVGKLKFRVDEAGGSGETIYALRRLEEEPDQTTLNLIGGVAPGFDGERWPTFDDEPMAHLFTLDLETMPPLQKRYPDARTISVFCHNPGYNEAWEAGNDQTAVLTSTPEQIDDIDASIPDAAPDRCRLWFEPIKLDVDPAVFDDRDSELRTKIYQAAARVLGEPIWLQFPEHHGRLIMQFDESFVNINLGDMGVMYVFDDTAFWQCH